MRKATLVSIICSLLTMTACTVGIIQRQAIVTAPPDTPPSETPAVSTEVPSQEASIFLIALEDNGVAGKPVGCGDSAVPVKVTIPGTQPAIQGALEALFSVKEQFYGESGMYNALYQSDLRVESVSVEGGKATIHLTGSLMLGGMCDNPRVQAQIEETALQFAAASEVTVFLNDQLLQDALSLKGE
ncbi:MAG: hypothetical protein ACK2US_20005 [Anaerolineae bacterium]